MTELERRLSAELRVQQQVFEQKLKEITSDYKSNLKQIADAYTQQISAAQRIIDKQSRLLERYENELSNLGAKLSSVQVTLDESPISTLSAQLEQFRIELDRFNQRLGGLERLSRNTY